MKKLLLILFLPLIVNAEYYDIFLKNPRDLNKDLIAYTQALSTKETQSELLKLEILKSMFLAPFGYPEFEGVEGPILIRFFAEGYNKVLVFGIRASEDSHIAHLANMDKASRTNTPLQDFNFVRVDDFYFFSNSNFEREQELTNQACQMHRVFEKYYDPVVHYDTDIHIMFDSPYLFEEAVGPSYPDIFNEKFEIELGKIFAQMLPFLNFDINFSSEGLGFSFKFAAEKGTKLYEMLSCKMPTENTFEYAKYIDAESSFITYANYNNDTFKNAVIKTFSGLGDLLFGENKFKDIVEFTFLNSEKISSFKTDAIDDYTEDKTLELIRYDSSLKDLEKSLMKLPCIEVNLGNIFASDEDKITVHQNYEFKNINGIEVLVENITVDMKHAEDNGDICNVDSLTDIFLETFGKYKNSLYALCNSILIRSDDEDLLLKTYQNILNQKFTENQIRPDVNSHITFLMNISKVLNRENENAMLSCNISFKDGEFTLECFLPTKDSKFLLNYILELTKSNGQ